MNFDFRFAIFSANRDTNIMAFSFFFIGFFVALLALVYLYFELKNTKSKFAKANKENAHKLFELNLLSEISEKVGYSLSTKDIAATIAATSERVFPVTAVSYAIIENDHIEITTIAHDNISSRYTDGVKDIILTGMYNIDDKLKSMSISHKIADKKATTDAPVDALPSSYFNVPLVLNNRFTGIINITSKTAHAFQEEDMSMLYKIVNRAQLAIGRLETVIEDEKGKVDALVKSLSSGEMFFTLKYDSLELYTINPAALRHLQISPGNIDIISVLSKFRIKPNIIGEMKEVITKKKSTIYRNIVLGEKRFNIYISPVFSLSFENVIGVALTMQDVTREHETQKMREGFTNMMVHELRAPLTAIKGAADLLLNTHTDEGDQMKMRLVIKNSSERLLRDIDDMLDSARIDAGKLLVHKVESSLNNLILKSIEEATYTAQDRSISIESHLDDEIPTFAFDPVRIGQVMANLLSNSVKYSDKNTVISVFSKFKNDIVEVEVKDQGIGVKKEQIESLFQPFAQGNFFKKAKGTGLGLYITKDIVTEHGGKIWLESEEGQGTSVFFKLPIEHEVPVEPKVQMVN